MRNFGPLAVEGRTGGGERCVIVLQDVISTEGFKCCRKELWEHKPGEWA
jgi:hypothetical protein